MLYLALQSNQISLGLLDLSVKLFQSISPHPQACVLPPQAKIVHMHPCITCASSTPVQPRSHLVVQLPRDAVTTQLSEYNDAKLCAVVVVAIE